MNESSWPSDQRASAPEVVFLMGPTAVGKSRVALELARRLPCEIISVDSALIYRGLDIGSAKPSAAVQAEIPHHLIDIRDPAESYSAGRFREDAWRLVAEVRARGRLPLLVGGTMLYFRAFERGLSPLPRANAAVRARLDAEAARLGWAALHARLQQVDPVAARRIHPNDPQRIQRALEVYALTGEPLTQHLVQRNLGRLPWRVTKLALVPDDRDALRRRIRGRFEDMLVRGLVEEVRRLYQRGDLSPRLPAIRSVGYRQVWAFLDSVLSYEAMVEAGVKATCQLAKRQMTWLRSEVGVRAFGNSDAEVVDKILKYIAEPGSSHDNGREN